MFHINEFIQIQKFNEKVIFEFRLITINNNIFTILNEYKIHLKKIEFNFNYFNNKRLIIVSKHKFVNFKNYARIVIIFRIFKRVVILNRMTFKLERV